jgi:hypothetical protein
MIATKVDLRYVVESCNGDYSKVVDEINKIAPKGLKGNESFIGNCLYCVASMYCIDESVDRYDREKFQEFVFDNYRVNGILGEITDVTTFNI